MRLTNTIREAFVRAVMNDVPQIDYKEQIIVIAQNDLIEQMPPKVRAVYDDPELREFLSTGHVYVSKEVRYRYLYGTNSEIRPNVQAALDRLDNLAAAQEEEREALRAKLTGVANSVTTRKALVALLPEFEKYLPEEHTSPKNLPAISGMVADLVKAGWPKGKQPPAATAA